MKSNLAFKALYAITAIIMLINIAFLLKNSLYYDINKLPKGNLMSSEISPDGKYTINMYLVKNSIGQAIRGEVVNGDSSKNIFWQTEVSSVDIKWASTSTVIINDVYLNLKAGTVYDSRRGKSIFQEGALEGIDAPNNVNYKNG